MVIKFFSDLQVRWGNSSPKVILLDPSTSFLNFPFLSSILTSSCHLRNSQNYEALEDNSVYKMKQWYPNQFSHWTDWWYWKAMSPLISGGYLAALFYKWSRSGDGLWCTLKLAHADCQGQSASLLLVLYLVYFWEKMEISRLWSTENKPINIKIFNMLTR